MFARLLAEAVPRTEDARVPQESVLRTECPFRTGKACFLHRVLPKTRRVPQESVLRTECPFRSGKACFLHRMPLKMRRVPQEAFLNTECSFRTVEACFWYGALPKTHRTWLSGAQASCYRCGTSNLTKERGRPFGRPPLK